MEDAHSTSTRLNLHTKEIDGKALDNNNNGIVLYQAIIGSLSHICRFRHTIAYYLCSWGSMPIQCQSTSRPPNRCPTYSSLSQSHGRSSITLPQKHQWVTNWLYRFWLGWRQRRKKVSRRIYLRAKCCGPIWQSRKQDLVATSILKADKDSSGYDKDSSGNGKDSNNCALLSIRCDNQGALAIIRTGVTKQRTKHIDVCYHNSRDLHARGIVEFCYINTDENTANLFTKPLATQKHQKFTAAAGLRQFWRRVICILCISLSFYSFHLHSVYCYCTGWPTLTRLR